jgi:hypothetical protein
MPHKVKFCDFDPARLIFGKIDEKQTISNGQTIKYYIINIQYLYEVTTSTGEKRDVKDSLYIEAPKIKSRGPQNKVYEDKGRSVWSIYSRFDLSDSNQYAFVNTSKETPGTMHGLAMKCAEFIFNNKKELNIKCSSLESMIDLMHYPIRWPDNDLESKDNPSAVFKLMCYGKDPNNLKKTSFMLPINGGKNIPWEFIMDSNIIHEPLLKFDNMTVASGRPSIKYEMVSSIIHEILPAGGENLQQDTLENAAKDANTVMLEARVKELEARLANSNMASAKEQLVNAPASVPAPIPSSPAEIPGLSGMIVSPPTMPVASVVPTMPVPPIPEPTPPVPTMPVASVVPTMDSILNSAPPALPVPGLPVPGLPMPVPATPLPPALPGLPGLPALP